MEKSAIISECEQYRYCLERKWHSILSEHQEQFVVFIMLNPSTADHLIDDPTIRRCIGYTKSWGYHWFKVVNLFAYRVTKSTELKKVHDPVGVENDRHVVDTCSNASLIVAAWGPKGRLMGRDKYVLSMLRDFNIHYIQLSKDGIPCHPLMLKKELMPKKFDYGCFMGNDG